MNKILEAYKELGLDGIFEYIESLHDRDYEYEDYDEDDTEEDQMVEEITEEDQTVDEITEKVQSVEELTEQVQTVEDASEDIEEAYLEKVMELEYLLTEKYRVFIEFPQTLLSALHGTELLNEPHIKEWYQYMKGNLKKEPILPLWKQPKKFENKIFYSAHKEFILGLVQLDENCFATSSEDGKINIWEYEPIEGQRIGDFYPEESLAGHDGKPVNNLAYDPKRRLIASAGDDHKIKLWNRDTYECVAVLEGHTNYVSYLVMGDNLLYSASKDSRIGVWDLDKMTNVAYLTEHKDWVVLLTLSPDNQKLISTSTNGDLFEWDAKTFVLKHKVNEGGKTLFVPDTDLYIVNNNPEMLGHDGHPEWFQWLSNNRMVTVDHELIIWDADKWSIIKSFGQNYFGIECFLIIDEYIVTFECTIKVFDINSGTLLKIYPVDNEDKIQRALFNKEEQLIITCSNKGVITIWDWMELLNGDSAQGIGVDVHSLEVFKDPDSGREIALCGGFSWELAVFDLDTGELKQRIQRTAGAKGFVDIKKHSATGQAVLLFEQSISLCDPFHPEVQQIIPLPQKSEPREILTTRHGILAASQSYPPYRINTKNQKVFAYDNYSYLEFIESPDGRYAIATTYPTDLSKDGVPFDEKLKPLTSPAIWLNLESGRKEGEIWYNNLSKHMKFDKKIQDFAEKNFKNHFPLYPTAAAWSPDGQQVAIGFNNGRLLIYDVNARKIQNRNGLEAGKYVSYMAWTEPHILTVFMSGTAYAVDSHTLKVVKSIAISKDPTYHYSSFGGGRYLVWGSGKRKLIGIFDTQEFSNKWTVSLPTTPRKVLVNEGRLIVGGEDGLLYAYSINGVI